MLSFGFQSLRLCTRAGRFDAGFVVSDRTNAAPYSLCNRLRRSPLQEPSNSKKYADHVSDDCGNQEAFEYSIRTDVDGNERNCKANPNRCPKYQETEGFSSSQASAFQLIEFLAAYFIYVKFGDAMSPNGNPIVDSVRHYTNQPFS